MSEPRNVTGNEFHLTLKMTGLLALIPGKGRSWPEASQGLGVVTVACVDDHRRPWSHHETILFNDDKPEEKLRLDGTRLRFHGKGGVFGPTNSDNKDLGNVAEHCAQLKDASALASGAAASCHHETDVHPNVQAQVTLPGGLLFARKPEGPNWIYKWGNDPRGEQRQLAEILELQFEKPVSGSDLTLKAFDFFDGTYMARTFTPNVNNKLTLVLKNVRKSVGEEYPEVDISFDFYYDLCRNRVSRRRVPHNTEYHILDDNGKHVTSVHGQFCPPALIET